MLRIVAVSIATSAVIALVVFEVIAVIGLSGGSDAPGNQIVITNSEPAGNQSPVDTIAQSDVAERLDDEIQELVQQRDSLIRELSILANTRDDFRALANSEVGETR